VEEVTTVVPNAQFVSGVAKLPDGLVLIHDLRTFLHDAEASDVDDAVAAAAASEGAP
jgi:purine-binding chemotaxis protein CheW